MDIPLDPLKCLDLVHEAIIPFDSRQKKTFDEFQYAVVTRRELTE